MAESMKDYETELEASFKKIEEGDILTGTVISVDEKEVVVDLKYYTEGIIPAEDYSREPGFSLKENVHAGDEVSATVVRKDDGNGNILLSRVEAADVLAWDKLKELKQTGEAIDVVVKGIVNSGVVAYVEGVRGFIPASKLALTYVEDTNEYLNKPLKVQVIDVDKANGKLILSAKELLREQAEEERKNKISNVQVGLVTEGVVESLQPYGAFVDLGNGLSGLVHISQICEKRIKKPSEALAVGDRVKVKVTAVKDGKLSLSIKEATDMMAKEIGENEVDDRIISMYQNLKSNGLEELSIGHVINWCNELDEQGYVMIDDYSIIYKSSANLKDVARKLLDELLDDAIHVDALIDKDSLVEYWIEQTSKEDVIDDLIRGNNIEELLGLVPETIYEDEYNKYLYSEIDC